MSDFAKTLKDLAKLCGKNEYQLAQLSGLDPSFVRRLFDGEKRASNQTIIRLTVALVMDPGLAKRYPSQVSFILNALEDAQLSDAIAELPESRSPNRWSPETRLNPIRPSGGHHWKQSRATSPALSLSCCHRLLGLAHVEVLSSLVTPGLNFEAVGGGDASDVGTLTPMDRARCVRLPAPRSSLVQQNSYA